MKDEVMEEETMEDECYYGYIEDGIYWTAFYLRMK